jgi:hypothetical protein
VEKMGTNVDQLKRVVSEVLGKTSPAGFDAKLNMGRQTDEGDVDSE